MPRPLISNSREPVADWRKHLRDADRALRNFINPPLSRVRAWQGSMGDAQISARPVRSTGEKITWHIEVSRGGQRVGAFETVLSGQLSDAQFRNLRGGRPSPLKSQILDILSAPQKRLHDLQVSVNVHNAPGGDSLQATIVTMEQYRDGQWQTQGYAVGEVRAYSPTPIYAGQRGEPLGYFRRSVGRGEAILRADGKPAGSLEEAKQLVRAQMSQRSLTAVSVTGAQKAAQVRRQIQADTKPSGSDLGQLVAWQAPVALDKPLEKMNPAERIAYTVKVAKQYLPADVGARLQALMAPQTLAALAAYAGSHALGVGFIGDGLGLAHMLAGTRDGLRQLDNYLRTTLRAKHPMELANAGRELSELMAPLLVEGGAALTARGIGRAARRSSSTTALAPVARRPASSIAAQFPAVGSVQVRLARHPEKALQVLKELVERGENVTVADMRYAQQLNLAVLKSNNGNLTTADKAYLRKYMPWADSRTNQLTATTAPSSFQTRASRNSSETRLPLRSAPSSATVNQTNSSTMTYRQTIQQPQQAASYLRPQSINSPVSMLAREMTMTVKSITADLQPSLSAEEKSAFNYALIQVLGEHLHELSEQGKLAWLQQLRKDATLKKHLRLLALQRQQDINDASHRSNVTPTVASEALEVKPATAERSRVSQQLGTVFWPRGTSPSPAITEIRSAPNLERLNHRLDELRENPGFKIWLKRPETLAEIEKSLKKIHGADYSERSWLGLGADVLQARLIQQLKAGAAGSLIGYWLGLQPNQTAEDLIQFADRHPNLIDAIVSTVNRSDLEQRWLGLGADDLARLRRTFDVLLHPDYEARTEERRLNPASHGVVSQRTQDRIEALAKLTSYLSKASGLTPNLLDERGQPLTRHRLGSQISLVNTTTAPIQIFSLPKLDWLNFGIPVSRPQVIVGDIHGNYDLWREGIIKISQWGLQDLRLVQLGDLLNKGYDPASCVSLMLSLFEIGQARGQTFPSSVTLRHQSDTTLMDALERLHANGLSVVPHMGNHEQISQQGDKGGYARHLIEIGNDVNGYLSKLREVVKKGGWNTFESYFRAYGTEPEIEFALPFLNELKRAPAATNKTDTLPPELEEQLGRFSDIWLSVLSRAQHGNFLRNELKPVAREGGVFTVHGGLPLSPQLLQAVNAYLGGGSLPESLQHVLLWSRDSNKPDVASAIAKAWADISSGQTRDPEVIVQGHTTHGNGVANFDPETGRLSLYIDRGFTTNMIPLQIVLPGGDIGGAVMRRGPNGIELRPTRWNELAGTGLDPTSNRPSEVQARQLFQYPDTQLNPKKKVTPPAESQAASQPTTLGSYSQHTQQPQQGSNSVSVSQEKVRNLAQDFLSKLGNPVQHLKLMTNQSGLPVIALDETQFVATAARAYTELRSTYQLNAIQIQQLVNALIIPHTSSTDNKIGLEALSVVWQTMFPDTPLTGDILVRLGRIISNRADFGTIQDMAGLVGYSTSDYQGLYSLRGNSDNAMSWIDPLADHLRHWRGFSGKLNAENMSRAPRIIDYLQQLIQAYDKSVQLVQNPTLLPWNSSKATDFVNSLARLEAWYAPFILSGIELEQLNDSRNIRKLPWESWVDKKPQLKQIDFSKAYTSAYEALRISFHQLLHQRLSSIEQIALAGVQARRLADKILTSPGNQAELFRYLSSLPLESRLRLDYVTTPQFEIDVRRILSRWLWESPEISLAWIKFGLDEKIWSMAQKLSARDIAQRTPLQALEHLMSEAGRKSEPVRELFLAARLQQQKDQKFLDSIPDRAIPFGMTGATGRPPVDYRTGLNSSIHDAVLKQLKLLPIELRLMHAEDKKIFIIDRNWQRYELPRLEVFLTMICNELSTLGYPTEWIFSD